MSDVNILSTYLRMSTSDSFCVCACLIVLNAHAQCILSDCCYFSSCAQHGTECDLLVRTCPCQSSELHIQMCEHVEIRVLQFTMGSIHVLVPQFTRLRLGQFNYTTIFRFPTQLYCTSSHHQGNQYPLTAHTGSISSTILPTERLCLSNLLLILPQCKPLAVSRFEHKRSP